MKHYKDLMVWKKAMDLVTEVYRLVTAFPDSEKFGLISQLRRAAVSVPSNIAEGQGRLSIVVVKIIFRFDFYSGEGGNLF